jgi:hypothetical protein
VRYFKHSTAPRFCAKKVIQKLLSASSGELVNNWWLTDRILALRQEKRLWLGLAVMPN